jgi:hypothetical protein
LRADRGTDSRGGAHLRAVVPRPPAPGEVAMRALVTDHEAANRQLLTWALTGHG